MFYPTSNRNPTGFAGGASSGISQFRKSTNAGYELVILPRAMERSSKVIQKVDALGAFHFQHDGVAVRDLVVGCED